MSLFDITVVDEDGELVVTVTADTDKEAREAAAPYGLVIRSQKTPRQGSGGALTSLEREVFLGKLATLLSSRVGTGAALRLLGEQFRGRPQAVARLLLHRIEAGADLCEALEQTGKPDFPPALVALVRSGLRAESTAIALEKACAFETEMRALGRVSRNGLWSAASGYLAAVTVVLVTMLWVRPRMATSPLMQAGKVDISWAQTSGTVLAVLMAISAVGGVLLLVNSSLLKRVSPLWSDRLTRKIPLWDSVALGKERFLGLQSLASLLAAGLPLGKVFRIAEDSSPKGGLAAQFAAAALAVERGEPWARALTDLDEIDRTALAGAVDRAEAELVLRRLAEQYKAGYVQSTQSLVLALQLFSALALTLGGGLLFAISILPVLQASAKIM